MSKRILGLTVGLVAILGAIGALNAHARAEKVEFIRSCRESLNLPAEAVVLRVHRTERGWVFPDTRVDFSLPGPESPEAKLVQQARRMQLLSWRKNPYYFRSPRTDFGYQELEYLPQQQHFRAWNRS